MSHKKYFIYIITNKTNTVLYTGVTNNLDERVNQHKTGDGSKFTSKYKCSKLLYSEEFQYIGDAIAREKQLKGWTRKKKEHLINADNPLWQDLAEIQ